MSESGWELGGRHGDPSPGPPIAGGVGGGGGVTGQIDSAPPPAAPDAPPHLPVIAHVLHRLQIAGAEVLAADLARCLRDRFRFVFLCLDGVGTLGQTLTKEGFCVVDLQRRPGIDLSVAGRIRQAVGEFGIQLLHAHQYTPFFYAAASRGIRTQPPILFTEHGRHYPDRRRFRRIAANRLLLRRHDHVTAVGEFVKRALVKYEGLRESWIEVVPNGIDPQRFIFERDQIARGRVRKELGLTAEQPMILQVARFHPVKDHGTAVRALADVVEQIPQAMLVLVGDGEERARIESLVHQLEIGSNVRFLGVRNDVPRLMAAADVFLLSSLSEGISVTLLEAMGCQLPIAATDVGGNAEVVGDGEAGLLSPRGDASALSDNILRLLRDPLLRLRLGQAGRKRLLNRFTQDKMHARYTAIYQQMAAV